MKHVLFIIIMLLYSNNTYSQELPDTCFTQSEIHAISNTLDSLYYIDSINNEIILTHRLIIDQLKHVNYLDSLQLVYKMQQISILEENIAIYIKREKLLTPKWYQHPATWFAAGIAATLLTGKMIVAIIQ
jgi:hypothetical protein